MASIPMGAAGMEAMATSSMSILPLHTWIQTHTIFFFHGIPICYRREMRAVIPLVFKTFRLIEPPRSTSPRKMPLSLLREGERGPPHGHVVEVARLPQPLSTTVRSSS